MTTSISSGMPLIPCIPSLIENNNTPDIHHISAFMSELPLSVHRRAALYVVRFFAREKQIDDIIETYLKPAIREMVTNKIYTGEPEWLRGLYSDSILSTIAEIQTELGGREQMQAEYNLIKKHFTEPLIPLNEEVGPPPPMSVKRVMLKLLVKPSKKRAYTPIPPVNEKPQEIRIQQACEQFKEWMNSSLHFGDDQDELLDWMYEDNSAEALIHSYEEFVQLAKQVAAEGYAIPVLPKRINYDLAVHKRAEKKLELVEYTTVFLHQKPLEMVLDKAAEKFEFWRKSYDLNGEDYGELVDWLFCDGGAKLIQSYQEFLDLAVQAHSWEYQVRKTGNVPDRSEFDQACDIFQDRYNRMNNVHQPDQYPALDVQPAMQKKIFRNRTILDLLPVSHDAMGVSEVSVALKKYHDFIMLAHEALAKFENREMPFFDPIAGENACHIRAAVFAEMLNRVGIQEEIQSARQQFVEMIGQVKNLMIAIQTAKTGVKSFELFLKQNKALLEISPEIAFIIASYILSDTKSVDYKLDGNGLLRRHERISGKELSQKKSCFNTNFANAIIKTAKTRLSELSVIYVQRIALQQLLSKEEKDASLFVFDQHVITDKLHRKSIPCYSTMRLLLNRMLRNHIPLVLKVEQYIKGQSKPYAFFSLLFGDQSSGNYSLTEDAKLFLKKGAVFINAKSITSNPQSTQSVRSQLLSHQVTDLILSAAADHPQYGCDDTLRPQDPTCDRYRQLAHQWGTCLGNPSLFLIDHIYCDTIEKQLINALQD